ncbi:MAG: tRNA (cytidine(34)-2'-O)-methyltransferase [Bacillota bacterium]|nr:tRNA (cytidine(34)-2'-O)-methyltransferase [Bacillota bacterium]
MKKLNIVLLEPEIPQNTGNIARTCAATGASLHLIKPLGFSISDKQVKRAGLDYWYLLDLHVYDNIDEFYSQNNVKYASFYYSTTKAPHVYSDVKYDGVVYLMFGRETAGLPESLILKNIDNAIRIPMIDEARSLNLSNSVAVVTYEVLRQWGFEGLKETGKFANL